MLFQDFNKVTHNYSQVGNYIITQKVWWAVCDSSEVIKNISLPLSINEIDNNPNLFIVYPNPANNLIEIKTKQSKIESIQLQIFDTQGKIIMSNQKSIINGGLTIDVSSLPNQLLFLKITDKNGVQQILKVVKE
jgi:hypothetical protein